MIDFQSSIFENNPWWENRRKIDDDPLIKDFSLVSYQYKHPLLNNFPFGKDAVLTLRGPRRVGKSTLLRLLIKNLLEDKVRNPLQVFLYYCDRIKDANELYELLKTYLDTANARTKERLYIFLDEISFVRGWQKAVKELWDKGRLKNTTTLLTGSSILDLSYSSEWLSGRRGRVSPADITYFPLSFAEFVFLVKPEAISKNTYAQRRLLPTLRKLMGDYLLTGGFPLTINAYYKNMLLSNDLYDTFITWTENDIHKAKKSDSTAYAIFSHLFTTYGNPISYIDLAKNSGLISHTACGEYVDIFQKMYLLHELPYFSINEKRTDIKKNKKYYFSDPFILHALRNKAFALSQNNFLASREFLKTEKFPSVVENIVGLHLKRKYPALYYGRFAKAEEIDFVGFDKNKYHFFEVKYQKEVDPSNFRSFQRSFSREHLTVISRDTFYEGKTLTIVPLEIFLILN